MNNILTILLDYIVQKTGNTHGFIGERKHKDDIIFYRYHAISLPPGTGSDLKYWNDYLTKGYFDLGSEHEMHKNINRGEIHINNSKQHDYPHPHIDRIICLPLYDASESRGVIGIVGLSGSIDFTKEIADTYLQYIEICSYILQLAIERTNINHHNNNFLLKVSHALREPIDGILGVSKLTNNASLTPVQRQYIDAVTFYSIKLLDMVNDIQDYTKMVSGTLNLINKTMSLQQCLDTVMLITQQKLGSNTVSLTLTSSPNIPDTIIADEIRITQILVNILDNACKFTKKGSVSLHISTSHSQLHSQSHLQSPHELEFTVTDTGSGMPVEQVKNIFTHNPKDGKGMGFGLLLVKYLVEMFGGNITLRSTPNVGTVVKFNLYVGRKIALTLDQIKQAFENTECLLYSEVRNQPLVDVLDIYGIKTLQVTSLKEFKKRFTSVKTHPFKFKILIFGKSTEDDRNTIIKYFKGSHSGANSHDWWRIITTEKPLTPNEDTYYLPSKDAVADVLTAIITNITETTLPPIDAMSTTRGRILIAEDNAACRDILVGFIIKLGYQDIDTVNDGLELYLKLTSDQEYDMVFVSLTIGVLDGFTAVKKYREKTSPGVGTIIIAVTGTISSGLKESCYACGMNGYILKPINMQDITKLDTMRIRRSYDLMKAPG